MVELFTLHLLVYFVFFNKIFLEIKIWNAKFCYLLKVTRYVAYRKWHVTYVKKMIAYSKIQDLEVWNFAHNPRGNTLISWSLWFLDDFYWFPMISSDFRWFLVISIREISLLPLAIILNMSKHYNRILEL
jgi:hypothetical protein